MGLNPEVFDSMTPAEFILAQYGWINRRSADFRQSMEIARFGAYWPTIVQIDPKHRRAMDVLIPLPWDAPAKQKEQKKLTPAERLARVRQIQGDHGKSDTGQPDGEIRSR